MDAALRRNARRDVRVAALQPWILAAPAVDPAGVRYELHATRSLHRHLRAAGARPQRSCRRQCQTFRREAGARRRTAWRGGGQRAARAGVELSVRAGIPRPDNFRLPVCFRLGAHRRRAHGAAVAAGPHDGGSWRDIGAGVRGRGAAGRCARRRVWLALRDPRLCGHVGIRRRRILVVLPADNE